MELCCCFCFKQKTAYEMRISDWSSDVCSSDLQQQPVIGHEAVRRSLGTSSAVVSCVISANMVDFEEQRQGLIMILFPEQCRAARGLLNWTQAELATFAGISRSTVRDFEGDRHQLRSEDRRVGKDVVSTVSSRWSP